MEKTQSIPFDMTNWGVDSERQRSNSERTANFDMPPAGPTDSAPAATAATKPDIKGAIVDGLDAVKKLLGGSSSSSTASTPAVQTNGYTTNVTDTSNSKKGLSPMAWGGIALGVAAIGGLIYWGTKK